MFLENIFQSQTRVNVCCAILHDVLIFCSQYGDGFVLDADPKKKNPSGDTGLTACLILCYLNLVLVFGISISKYTYR
jgi:hypothetical protein